MKWMIAGDIHGSAYWCERLMRVVEKEQPDKLVLMGDLLYHGPRNGMPQGYDPAAVADMLNAVSDKIICVRGNCDSEVDQLVLSFPITVQNIWLCDGGTCIFATHGHVYNLDNMPPLHSGDVLLHGHTHVQACVRKNGVLYVNPGSVTFPKEDSYHGYITLQNGVVSFVDLSSGQVRSAEKIVC